MPAPQTGTAKGISHATDPLGGQDATPLHQLQARPFQLCQRRSKNDPPLTVEN